MVKILSARVGLLGGPSPSTAIFSDDKMYRYVLERVWSPSKGRCVFICLNPSTADEIKNDPTVSRCINHAKEWGYGAFIMLNAFAYRSTDPAALRSVADPVGPENDEWISKEVGKAAMVIAAWGTHATYMQRHDKLLDLFKNLHCLGTTKDGYPRHPLYMKKDVKPIFYER